MNIWARAGQHMDGDFDWHEALYRASYGEPPGTFDRAVAIVRDRLGVLADADDNWGDARELMRTLDREADTVDGAAATL